MHRTLTKNIRTCIWSLVIVVSIFIVSFLVYLAIPLPTIDDQRIVIYDRHGDILYTDYRYYQPTKSSEYTSMASKVVAIEDATFWRHPGISLRGLVRATRDALGGERQTGGSTITMQLARMRYLQNEPRNITYKIRQMLLALKLETRMSKGEILDEYLHRVYLGSGTFGFAAAAQRYFATPVSLLTDAQQTLLIALLPSPEASNPLTHPDHAKNQRDLVLEKLADKDIIDPSRLDELRSAPLTLNPSHESVVTAPHFALRMYDKVTDMGLTGYVLHVTTTLDRELYEDSRRIISQILAKDQENDRGHVAVVGIRDQELVLELGSMDFFDEDDHGAINSTISKRQMGSTLKPFLFAYALEHGGTPLDALEDIRTSYPTSEGTYKPHNYYAKDQYGLVRYRESLGGSYNLSPIYLLHKIGVGRWLNYLQQFDLHIEEDALQTGLSLVLGTGESNLFRLTRAYTTFAHSGEYQDVDEILEITDTSGHTLYTPSPRTPERRMSVDTAEWVTHALSDTQAKWDIFKRGSSLEFEFDAAVKTGTSENYMDHFVVGYSPEVTLGVWRGYVDRQPLTHNENSQHIWHSIMRRVHTGKNNTFTYVGDRREVSVCRRPTQTYPQCSESYIEFLLPSEMNQPTRTQTPLTITNPGNGARLHHDSPLLIQVSGLTADEDVLYMLDGKHLGGPHISSLSPGDHILKVVQGNREAQVEFVVEKAAR